ncbi:beta-galactosidase trimerization domain-containing protein [candidate division KSB1 bacterium]|nr:beta-galactosidase trimerization domain-containing protein [candidate division KSB1 bacterium]
MNGFPMRVLLILLLGIAPVTAADKKADHRDSFPLPPWYERPMRIAALQCNFESDNIAVVDTWKEMGFNVEQLFHPMADLYSAIYQPEKHREILENYIRRAHAEGIRVILYWNVHILGPSLFNRQDEWSQRDREGKVTLLYDTYPSICINSPWRDEFFRIMDQVDELDIDGIFLDGPVLLKEGCFCPHCQAAFRDRYGVDKSEGSAEQLWQFNADSRDAFLGKAYTTWKERHPHKVFYINLPILHIRDLCVNLEQALAYNDIIGTEGGFMPYGPAQEEFLWKPSFAAKMLEAVAPDKPRVIFMAADHKPWNWWLHSPLETRLCIASTIANGANIWYGLHGSTALLDTPGGKAAGEILRFYRDNEDLLHNVRSLAETAIVYSFTSARFYKPTQDPNGDTEERAADAEKALQGMVDLLTESQIPFDIVTDLQPDPQRWQRYKTMVIPAQGAMDQPMAQALRDWVAQGGTLIAELDVSAYDGRGQRLQEFNLSDLFGVSLDSLYLHHNNWNYFQLDSAALFPSVDSLLLWPLPLTGVTVIAHEGTAVLARALGDLPGRYVELTEPVRPLITRRSFGEGTCYYLAGSFGEMYRTYHVPEYRQLVASLIHRHSGEGIAIDPSPSYLEVTWRGQGNKRILHLVNYQAGAHRPFTHQIPMTDLWIDVPLSQPIHRAYSCALQKELQVDSTDNRIRLPRLETVDMIVIE